MAKILQFCYEKAEPEALSGEKVYEMKKDICFALGVILFTCAFIIGMWGIHQLTRPNFTLTATNGQTVTLDDLRAKPAAVFFGYTRCPDVCPTTLVDMNDWLEELGPDAQKIGIWFITIDPARDTPELLRDYISNVSDKVIGLSGSQKETDKALAFFRATAKKVESGDGDYTFDHTAAVILVKKNGIPFDAISYQADNETALGKLRDLIKSGA